ncbi:hypothetical protein HDV63DRAFT_122306 [Trichoderma sp. SZMC 28014]
MPASSTAGISVPLVLRSTVAAGADGSCTVGIVSSLYLFVKMLPWSVQHGCLPITITFLFFVVLALPPNMFTVWGLAEVTGANAGGKSQRSSILRTNMETHDLRQAFQAECPKFAVHGGRNLEGWGRGIMAGYVKLHPASRVSPCAHTPYSITLTPFPSSA